MLVTAHLQLMAIAGWHLDHTSLVGACLAFAEAMLGVGIVLPGEVLITGLAASTDGPATAALIVAVAIGASAGDHVNYLAGRLLGTRLPRSRIVTRIGVRHWERGTTLIQRHGAWAIILSRLIPVVRTLMPAVAGVSQLRYRSFLLASLAGSTIWSFVWVSAGSTIAALATDPRLLVAALVGALALGGIVLARRRRR